MICLERSAFGEDLTLATAVIMQAVGELLSFGVEKPRLP